MIASLGMYDHPRQRQANDAIWSAIAHALHARGIAAPTLLDRRRPVEQIWRDPSLLLAQACGYPLVADSDLELRVIAVPSYAVPDCDPGRHCSRIVVHATNPARSLAALRGSVAAINAWRSNTGANLLRAAIAPLANGVPFFDKFVVTGSHRESLRAVADGRAAVAAIDAVTLAAIERYEPGSLAMLRVLHNTRSTPALPFVTHRSVPVAIREALQAALADVMSSPDLGSARQRLFLSGIAPADGAGYEEVRGIASDAAAANWPTA